MATNRREQKRIPVCTFLTEYVDERARRGMITDISEHGLRVQRPLCPTHRRSRMVQLEFELPGTNDVIWARGEACFDELSEAPFGPAAGGPAATIHSSGVRLVTLADRHRRLMREYITERRRRYVAEIIARIPRQRVH